MKSIHWIIAGLIFIGAVSVSGQDLSGTVSDANTGEPLIGAAVQIMDTKSGDITDLEGRFLFTNLPVKRGSLLVRYVGYDVDTVRFDLDERHDLTISMVPVSTELEEVQVLGRFEGQQKALYEQKIADNIKNVVASEQIKLFPDMNAAEAVQRIPGITLQRDQGEGRFVQVRGTPPELTNFNVNGEQIPSPEGDVRYVGLDVISSDQIEFIEVTKALTPDMDADGIGGNVNIVTKTAESFVPNISASLAGGYNNLMKTPNYQGQFSFGQRYNKFGFHINGSYYENNQGSHNMEFKFVNRVTQDNPEFHPVYDDIQLRHYEITRKRTGLSATLDYRFNANSSLYLRAMYNKFSDDETRSRIRYRVGSGTIISDDKFLEPTIVRDVKDRVKIQEINTVNLGGENRVLGGKLDYEVAYSTAVEDQPNRMEAAFETYYNLNVILLDLEEYNWPRIILPTAEDSLHAFDLSNYEFEELLMVNSMTTDRNLTYKVNYEYPINLFNQEGFIKFGGKIRQKRKERDNRAFLYNDYYKVFKDRNPSDDIDRRVYLQVGPEFSMENVATGPVESNLLGRGYDMWLTPDPGEMRNFYEFYSQNFALDEAGTKDETYSEDYVARENIYAGYAMFRQNVNKLMVLGGVRYERTDVNYQGYDFQIYKGRFFQGLEEMESERTYEFLLPQVHLKYRLNPNTNFRLAATYSYSRPNFEDILPYKQEDIDEVQFGNPNLIFPVALNIDLLAETYLKQGGLVSGGLFYKKIDDFIFYYKRFVHLDSSFSTAGLKEVTMAQNGLEAFVYGAEVNSNVKFSFLPGFLGNFGVYFNYTYTYSEAYINKRVETENLDNVFIYDGGDGEFVLDSDETEMIPLPGQAMHTANLALFYDADRFYAKLAGNFHDAFLIELGQEKAFDEYYDRAFHLDFSADYRLNDRFNIFVDLVNITDAPLKIYMGKPDIVKQQEYYSFWGRIGMKFNF